MVIVMAVLLMATATAAISLHNTAYEIRGAGHARLAIQTQYVSEAALNSAITMIERMGPSAMQFAMSRSTTASTTRLAVEEPTLGRARPNMRINLDDFASQGTTTVQNQPLEDGSLGERSQYQPDFSVDVNDAYTFLAAVPGQRVDGAGQLQYMMITVTARGRARPQSSSYVTAAETAEYGVVARNFNETASNSRAVMIVGPFGRI